MSASDSESDHLQLTLLEGLAGSLGASVAIFDRDDTLIYSSGSFDRFFPLPEGTLKPGMRLRDFLGAIYDCGVRFGGSGKGGGISRNDWIAERTAIHWRERYENVEQLPDGRWVKLGKRRMPGGVLICHISDVTDQKRRDEDVKEARGQTKLARHVFQNLPNPALVKDETLSIVLINKAFCRLVGVEEHEVIGRSAADLVGLKAARIFEERERRVLNTGEPLEFVEDIPDPDGTLVRSITRLHRLGFGGNHYISISIDRIATRSDIERRSPANRVSGVSTKTAERTRKRVLVVDQNWERAEARVASLHAPDVEAMAIDDLRHLFSFLDTARAMDVKIDSIEVSPEFETALADNPAAADYPALAALLTERITRDLARRNAEACASDAQAEGACLQDASSPAERHHGQTPADNPHPSVRVVIPVPPLEGNEKPVPPELGIRSEDKVSAPTQKVRILVAEDNDVNQIVFEQILEALGLDYRIVSNGQDAVDAWREMKPDLVLMDVSMPVMNGHQATQRIREEERAGKNAVHTPILAVTAHAMVGDADACFAAGMDDYLTKPVSPERLESAIFTWVKSVGGAQSRS